MGTDTIKVYKKIGLFLLFHRKTIYLFKESSKENLLGKVKFVSILKGPLSGPRCLLVSKFCPDCWAEHAFHWEISSQLFNLHTTQQATALALNKGCDYAAPAIL